MTGPAWPAYARIRADYALSAAPAVARTPWDDGAVRQARIYTEDVLAREVEAHVPDDRLPDFRRWISGFGARYFAWPDPIDGAVYEARIRGGAGGVRYRQTRRSPGPPLWEVSMTIEGPDRPLAVNLWAATVPVGDSSHVYARGSRSLRLSRSMDTSPPATRDAVSPYAAAARAGAPLPGWWFAVGTGAAELRLVAIDRVHPPGAAPRMYAALRTGLRADPAGSTKLPGPDLLAGAAAGLALILRALGSILVVAPLAGADADEPYDWQPPNGPDIAAWLDRIAAAGIVDHRESPREVTGRSITIEWALVWAGAGSVVDTALGYTALGGRRPLIG